MSTLFLLSPAAWLLAMVNTSATLPAVQALPAETAKAPTFDPNSPPTWWTDKMRQPCTKTGDRIVC